MTDQPRPTVGPVHEHAWQAAGLTGSVNGDTIPALCGCGETRRFAVPDHVTYILNGIETTAASAWDAIGAAARMPRGLPTG